MKLTFERTKIEEVIDKIVKAIDELFRIIRKGGLVLISFDGAEEEDFLKEHIEMELGG